MFSFRSVGTGMGQRLSSWVAPWKAAAAAAAARDLDDHAAGLVVSRLGPWSRARCACINTAWKRAVDGVSFPDATNQHWLVDPDGVGRLWMCNVVAGYEKVVELNFPWDSIPTEEDIPPNKLHIKQFADLAESRLSRVLCSFQGLVLIGMGRRHRYSLVLGDPLLNKWITLPRPECFFLSVGAFCSDSRTLMVTDEMASHTATFDFATAEWEVDACFNPDVVGPLSQACCVDGVFYCTFDSYPVERSGGPWLQLAGQACAIARYDPVKCRHWRIVREFHVTPDVYFPVFVAQSRGKMLVYMTPDDKVSDDYRLLEASSSSSEVENEQLAVDMPCSLVDDEDIRRRISFPVDQDDDKAAGVRFDDLTPAFHGKDGMLFWESFDMAKRDKITVVSLDDRSVKELTCTRYNSRLPPSKYYYVAAAGTAEVLDDLALRLERKGNRFGRERCSDDDATSKAA